MGERVEPRRFSFNASVAIEARGDNQRDIWDIRVSYSGSE